MRKLRCETRRRLQRLLEATERALFYDDLYRTDFFPALYSFISLMWCKNPDDLMYNKKSIYE